MPHFLYFLHQNPRIPHVHLLFSWSVQLWSFKCFWLVCLQCLFCFTVFFSICLFIYLFGCFLSLLRQNTGLRIFSTYIENFLKQGRKWSINQTIKRSGVYFPVWKKYLYVNFHKRIGATPPKGHHIFKVREQLATHFKRWTYGSSDHAFIYLFIARTAYIYICFK